MYVNAMHVRSARDSLNAHSDAQKFRTKLLEWRRLNPKTPDHEMPDWLVELKMKAEASAKHNLDTQAVKSAMEMFPPMR